MTSTLDELLGDLKQLRQRAMRRPSKSKGKAMSKKAPSALKRKSHLVTRLQLDSEAKKLIDELADRRGMTMTAVLSRLVAWFGKQDEVIQASVLGHLSSDLLGTLVTRK